MPNVTLSLDHFNQPVPTCQLTIDSEALLTIVLSRQTESIVVVDPRRFPIGIIERQSLVIYLLEQQRGRAGKRISSQLFDLSAFVRPIVTVNAQMGVEEYLEQLTGNTPILEPILVDARGKLVGRLDTGRLLRFLRRRETRADKSVSNVPERTWQERPIEFLDQMPVPVLLYTDLREIFYRNGRWQEQIGESWGFPPLLPVDPLHPPLFPQRLETSTEGIFRVWQLLRVPLNFFPGHLLIETNNEVWLVLAIDVTEQQECCLELAGKNAALVHLNRVKDEFLSCISHELKSPLTAVVGLSNLLREQKIGDLNPRQSHYADLIYSSGRQLMTLVNNLLDLTRLETGQMKLNPMRLKVARLCQQAYEMIVEKYQHRADLAATFRLEIESGCDYLVADELRVQQMLGHLLDNAVKFTGDGGNFGIKVNRWENWLAFTVWDTGIGIPEESQPLIFQKFQQLESPLTRQFEGAGLGLVLTQKLARIHGGDISFISQVGQGSQFTLLLPPHPLDEPVDPPVQHRLTLVVESSPKAIDHLLDHLSELGMKVIIARTGTEAIEKARQLQPRCIFLNPSLPILSGWDVLTLLKSHPRTKAIPVVITATAEERARGEQQGAEGFLVPPITSSALQACLNLSAPTTQKARERRTSPTILRLYGSHPMDERDYQFNWIWTNQLVRSPYRFLEADSLEQAELLASVWEVSAIVIDRSIAADPLPFLQSLGKSESLAHLPLVTLDVTVTEAANSIRQLSVFPCLALPTENRIEQLLQVIEIAGTVRS